MAIYHFSAKIISRGDGRSAVAAAAYRSASELPDKRLRRSHDFTAKTGVIHSEILLPEGAPKRLSDRIVLWNEVEATEKRKDAQLAREVEFAIPREMRTEEGIQLAQDFVRCEFVNRGMIADLNVHWDYDAAGQPKPHAHVMLTMREIGPDGFGKKVREWNVTPELTGWRERWANHVNQRCAELGHDVRVDHRTLAAQGIDLEPQHKTGPAGMRRARRGEDAERAAEHREIARRNGERMLAEPEIALRAVTTQHSTFSRQDLARLVHRQSDGIVQFDAVMARVETSPEMVRLGTDERGRERFTTREMIGVEAHMEEVAGRLVEGYGHHVSQASLARALDDAKARGMVPGEEQVAALSHVTGEADLALVVGYAGTGKSAMLGVAREAWEQEGYSVRGVALSGIAAEGLEGGSGIASRTIASLEYAWARGREELTSRDVLVVDEAGMVGSRQMERVLSAASQAGAKVVLVGDPEQLQAIEAGAAFRALSERHGVAETTEIRRQHVDWQRDATRELASAATSKALDRYRAAGAIHAHDTRGDAKAALIERWNAERQERPDQSQVILAYTRADVRDLNDGARSKLREAGELGSDHALQTERGERSFAAGDRLMFLRNERSMAVKNGTLGTVEHIKRLAEAGKDAGARLTVRLDGAGGRTVSFDTKDYAWFDHGYAATIHKTQGVTVDRAHILATSHIDRHAAYVGLSRHREGVDLHYGREDFTDYRQLVRTFSRERTKDVTLDYTEGFAERRGITLEGIEQEGNGWTIGLSRNPEGKVRVDEPERSSQAAREVREYEGRAFETERLAIFFYAEAHGRLKQAEEAGHPTQPHALRLQKSHADLMATIGENRAGDVAAALIATPQFGIDLVKARRLPIAERDVVRDRLMADLGGRVQAFEGQRLHQMATSEVQRAPAFSIANASERAAVFDYARAFARLNKAQSAHHLTAPHENLLKKTEQSLEKAMKLTRASDVRVALQSHPDIASDLLQSRNLPVAERDAARDRFFSQLTSRGEEVAEHRIERERQHHLERARERSLSYEYDLGIGR